MPQPRSFCLLIATALTIACTTVKHLEAQMITAHRGASHDAPENTMAAFRLAWQQGADAIEGDFRLSKDGKIVCVHDEDFKRVAADARKAADLDHTEIRGLDVGSWKHSKFHAERPPTLAEVLAGVPRGKRVFLELKTGPEIVAPLGKALSSSGRDPDAVVVIAFDEQTVAECKRRLPDVRCHWLTGFKEKDGVCTPTAQAVRRTLQNTKADGVGFQGNREVLTTDFLQQAGVKEFHVWTIDDPADARYFLELGAWGITTNRPGWLREQLGRLSD